MAKDWVKISTINDIDKSRKMTDVERRAATRSFDNLIRNTESLSLEDMEKQAKESYRKNKEREDSLVQAYNDKRLKSEKAIAEAKEIIKARKKAEEKRKAEAPKKKVVKKKAPVEKKETSQTAN